MRSKAHRKPNASKETAAAELKPCRPAKANPSRRQSAEALILELKALRSVLKESAAQFEIKHSGRIAEMIRLLEGDPATGEKPVAPRGKQRDALMTRLRQTKFKPKKGRLKDLVALHTIVDMLAESLGSLSDRGDV
ncbi:MAG TPA: hypothetical protein PLY66_06115 [Acidobacteriota bacterium]|nr:hypothetical protein [Acidobacteriota bacterium]HOT00565.1 hypothetical protein [Acidobacteriota bacterium]HQF88632.1 hypothetical protein [Acidobacteriota bacterium]HQG91530.1 hypothetical protein [Acidobacteriota bacterium]HQK86090.1 hypothetical protein [Acidobacteriota bacterium]